MKIDGKVAIVGGSVVGLYLANLVLKNGFHVEVFEEDEEIGKPVKCAGLVSRKGLEEHNIKYDEILINKIDGAIIEGPYGAKMEVNKEDVAYVIDREKLEKILSKKVEKQGGNIYLGHRFLDLTVEKNHLFLKPSSSGAIMKKADVVVGADGAFSKTREVLKINDNKKRKYVYAYFGKAKGNFIHNKVVVSFRDYIKGFFAWIIPEGKDVARVGIGVEKGQNPKEVFYKYVNEKGLEVLEESSSVIPIGSPIEVPAKEKQLLVGDSAFHTKATTGGGIYTGLLAAKKAEKAIEKYFLEKLPLDKTYPQLLKPLYKELELHAKARRFLDSLSPYEINKLVDKLSNSKMLRILEEKGDMDKLSPFIHSIFSPINISLIPYYLKFLRS